MLSARRQLLCMTSWLIDMRSLQNYNPAQLGQGIWARGAFGSASAARRKVAGPNPALPSSGVRNSTAPLSECCYPQEQPSGVIPGVRNFGGEPGRSRVKTF